MAGFWIGEWQSLSETRAPVMGDSNKLMEFSFCFIIP